MRHGIRACTLQAPPPAEDLAAASYLVSCLERFATCVHPHDISASSTTSITTSTSGKDTDGLGGRGPAVAVTAVGALGPPPPGRRGRVSESGGGGGPSFTVPWEDWLLLGSVILDQLAPHLLEPHITSACLIPMLMRLASPSSSSSIHHGPSRPHAAASPAPGSGPASPAALSHVLHLLELVLEPQMLSVVVTTVMEALSRRCVSAALVPEHFPTSGSYHHLALAVALASRPTVRSLWLKHPNAWQALEGFLTRKGPSPDDLKQLLPHVWWRGCAEGSPDRELMRGALQALSAAIARVEDKQYELLACLLGCTTSGDAPGGGGSRGGSTASGGNSSGGGAGGGGGGGGEGKEDALVEFLRYLVQRNRGASRDIPPPGLSGEWGPSGPGWTEDGWVGALLAGTVHSCLDSTCPCAQRTSLGR